jgi:hypothetical protein
VIVGNFFTIPILLDYHGYGQAGALMTNKNYSHKTVPLPLQAGSTIKVNLSSITGGVSVTTAQLYLVKTADLV